MRTIVKCLVAAAVLASASCTADSSGSDGQTSGQRAEPPSKAALTSFVTEIDAQREAAEVPGAAIAVVHRGAILTIEGLGVKREGSAEPVTADTLFHIGSTQKPMTSMLVATMVDDGDLEWDQPLIEVVDELTLADDDATEMLTMRHLLSMTSGIGAEAEDALADNGVTPGDLFDLAADAELAGHPGDEFSYSNVSASLAGYSGVLAAGGDPDELYEAFERELQERILDPIGMTTATLSATDAQAQPSVASPHVLEGDEVVAVDSEDVSPDALAPSGALKANAIDMARFLITQASGGVAPDGRRVVSEEALGQTWQSPLPQPDGPDYGLGWDIGDGDDAGVLSHEGAFDNFTSVVVVMPELEAGFVLLTNLDDPGDLLVDARAAFIEYANAEL